MAGIKSDQKLFNPHDLYFDDVDKSLNHLQKEEIVELMERYYAGHKMRDIVDAYELKIRPSQLVELFPPMVTEHVCPYCDVQLLLKWSPKSAKKNKNDPECNICGHTHQDEGGCQCKNCVQISNSKKSEIQEKKRNMINEAYKQTKFKKYPEIKLTLTERLYLATLLMGGSNEDKDYITSLDDFGTKIAPTEQLSRKVIDTLIDNNILRPDTSSPLDAFEYDQDYYPGSYYIYKVNYRIDIEPSDGDYKAMIYRLTHPKSEQFILDTMICYDLWQKIAEEEIIEYLLHGLKKVNFYADKICEETEKVVSYILEHYSVAQAYSIIYKAIANTSKEYLEGSITADYAASRVIYLCWDQVNKSVANNSIIKPCQRLYELDESLLSKVFFNHILDSYNLGFVEKPSILRLEKLKMNMLNCN